MADAPRSSVARTATANSLPSRIGSYRILRRLGEGGMGVVYLGTDDALGRDAAVKVMLPKAASNPITRERFLREGRAMAKIRSPYVVEVYQVGEDNGVPYIAMEYLAGMSVEDRIKSGETMPIPEVIRIIREAALGLAAAHLPGLVHRDIKPSNLWLQVPSGRVKVLDFGLARDPQADTNLTRAGTVLGTPAYMAPEQARGLPVDCRTDLFSLGAVAYHLLTGKSPFLGKNAVETLTRVVTEEPAPIRDLRPDIPDSLVAVLSRLLSKDAAGRYATAQDLADALEPPRRAPTDTLPLQLPATTPSLALAVPGVANGEAASSEKSQIRSREGWGALDPTSSRPRRRPFAWGPVLGLMFAVAAAGVVYAALTLERPASPTSSSEPPPVTVGEPPPLVQPSPDGRALADWAVRRGYAFRIAGHKETLRNTTTVPAGPIPVTLLLFEKGKFLDLTPEDRKFFFPPDSWTDTDLLRLKSDPAMAKLRLGVINSPLVSDQGILALETRTGTRYLDLRGTKVTDRGVEVTRKMPALERISIADTAVGDVGLIKLSEHPKLRWVDARGSQVTKDGVNIFKANRRDCEVLTSLREGR